MQIPKKRFEPPKSWNNSNLHFREAIENPWYKLLFQLYAEVYKSTNKYFESLGYKPALMPITVQSVSSPMGLGSDSLPVMVNLFDKKTYLADSMQFQLEYMLRHECNGVYYIMPTFRGENPDDRHLNQFFHSEAEIKGDLETVMNLIENYLGELTESILQNISNKLIPFLDSDLNHLRGFIKNIGNLPRISFEDACKLLKNDSQFFSILEGNLTTISNKGEQELIRLFNGAVWLTHPRHEVVPFYQAVGCH